jgi:hypothetical protein
MPKRSKKNLSFEGDALRSAQGKNDVVKEIRSHQEPPKKFVPSQDDQRRFRSEQARKAGSPQGGTVPDKESEKQKLNPMAERKRKAA